MEKMKLFFLLDCSGSMSGLENEMIAGFNAMIAACKKMGMNTSIDTIVFDHEMKVIHEKLSLRSVGKMTKNEYYVRGTTALYDAIGTTIIRINQKQIKKGEKPSKVLFVIVTDGMDNASQTFVLRDIKRFITKKKTEERWQFIFLGANIDALQTAASLGIDEEYAAAFRHDTKG
ncbi:MAG: VWA domain-containing protein, partial [Bacilli bacterium]|nr:VWA domain-containing protein [Bacilli bacterium]